MTNLEEFFDALTSPSVPLQKKVITEFTKVMGASLRRQYIGDPANDKRPSLRMSSLGKPAVYNAFRLPAVRQELRQRAVTIEALTGQPVSQGEVFGERTKLIFHAGDWFEAWAATLVQRAGYKMVPIPAESKSEDDQWRVEHQFEGSQPIVGHLDLVVEGKDGVPFIIEVKTMSDQYWRSFTGLGFKATDDMYLVQGGGDDERAYMTQLALYRAATGFDGVWLAINKATFQIAVVQPDNADLEQAMGRALRVSQALSSITSLRDAYTKVKAPPGEVEVYKRSRTGRLILPASMRYDTEALPLFFYATDVGKNGYGKNQVYVGDYDVAEFGSDELSPQERARHTDYVTYDDIWES